MNEFNSPWITPFQRMREFSSGIIIWGAKSRILFRHLLAAHCRGFHLGICFSLFKPDRHSAQSHPFFFLGAIILWTVLRRGQHEITFSLMEDAWSRNLQNIVMTPVNMVSILRPPFLFGVIKLVLNWFSWEFLFRSSSDLMSSSWDSH